MRSQLGIGLSCSPIPGQGKVVVEGEGIFLPLSGLSGREYGHLSYLDLFQRRQTEQKSQWEDEGGGSPHKEAQ